MPPTDAVRRKALQVLREGRVVVLSARSESLCVTSAVVRVHGSRGVYVVDLRDGVWTCTCSRGVAGVRCGHITAAQLITGHANGGSGMSDETSAQSRQSATTTERGHVR